MRTAAPRTKTPAVEPNMTRDVTEREAAPPLRPNPLVTLPPPDARARRATLVSPIPALLAASMTEVRDDRGDATPLPIDTRSDQTSRFSAADQHALLMSDEADYVVEVGDPDKTVA